MSLSSWALKTIKMKETLLLLDAASCLWWECLQEAQGRETLRGAGTAALQLQSLNQGNSQESLEGIENPEQSNRIARPWTEEPVTPCPRTWPTEICESGNGAWSHCEWSSVTQLLFAHAVKSDSLPSHGLQHARLPCPSLTPRVCQIHVHCVSDANYCYARQQTNTVSCSLSLPNVAFISISGDHKEGHYNNSVWLHACNTKSQTSWNMKSSGP